MDVTTSLVLGKSTIKWRQRSDMSITVDWDVKHQFKQKGVCNIGIFHEALVQIVSGILKNEMICIILTQIDIGALKKKYVTSLRQIFVFAIGVGHDSHDFTNFKIIIICILHYVLLQ